MSSVIIPPELSLRTIIPLSALVGTKIVSVLTILLLDASSTTSFTDTDTSVPLVSRVFTITLAA